MAPTGLTTHAATRTSVSEGENWTMRHPTHLDIGDHISHAHTPRHTCEAGNTSAAQDHPSAPPRPQHHEHVQRSVGCRHRHSAHAHRHVARDWRVGAKPQATTNRSLHMCGYCARNCRLKRVSGAPSSHSNKETTTRVQTVTPIKASDAVGQTTYTAAFPGMIVACMALSDPTEKRVPRHITDAWLKQ